MFYIANALLYKMKYKVGERIAHKVTVDALVVFARDILKKSLFDAYEDTMDEALATIKSNELIEYLNFERRKRNFIQYNTTDEIKLSKVKTSLDRAKEFTFQIGKILID